MTDKIAVGATGWVEVRVDTEHTDGWCFCSPRNHPMDIEMGQIEGEFSDRYQFFGHVVASIPPTVPLPEDPAPKAKTPFTEKMALGQFGLTTPEIKAQTQEITKWWHYRDGACQDDGSIGTVDITIKQLNDLVAYLLIQRTTDRIALERDLVAECERAMAQRDEFKRTGISTAGHTGASHDTCFGFILRKYGIVGL